MHKYMKWKALCLGAFFVLLTSTCRGQAVYGSIIGTVTDNTGAVVPGASITVTDANKGTSVTVESNASGDFAVDHMIPDPYNVTVTVAGFKKYEAQGLQVYADQSLRVDPRAVPILGAPGGRALRLCRPLHADRARRSRGRLAHADGSVHPCVKRAAPARSSAAAIRPESPAMWIYRNRSARTRRVPHPRAHPARAA